jgi:nitrogenase-stabilizing/protective protein
MNMLTQLQSLSSAEEFFETLGVSYDPAVLRVARLHILKRMGDYLRKEDLEGVADDVVTARCRATLEHAYEDFRQSGPLEQRVFKVLKDAVKEPEPAFVSLDTLSVD